MSAKIRDMLRNAARQAEESGIKIVRGPWSVRDADNNVTAACITGAYLWSIDKHNEEHKIRELCVSLEIDPAWLRRFWMGFDRGYEAVMLDKDGREIGKDEVSQLGIELAREFCR